MRKTKWLLAGLVGLGLVGVTNAAIVLEDDFDSYANGSSLPGQGGWTSVAGGTHNLTIYKPGANGAVLMSGGSDDWWARLATPAAFSQLTIGGPGHAVEWDWSISGNNPSWLPYVQLGNVANEGNRATGTQLTLSAGDAGYPDFVAMNALYDMSDGGTELTDIAGDSRVLQTGWNHVKLVATRTGTTTMTWDIYLNAQDKVTLNKNYVASDGVDFIELFYYGTLNGNQLLLDNLKMYDNENNAPVPEPETVWMIVAVLASLGVTFRRQLMGMLVKA